MGIVGRHIDSGGSREACLLLVFFLLILLVGVLLLRVGVIALLLIRTGGLLASTKIIYKPRKTLKNSRFALLGRGSLLGFGSSSGTTALLARGGLVDGLGCLKY